MAGPLSGIRIVEFAGIGPGPFCGMMLADHGAEVIRIERPGARHLSSDAFTRSRRTIAIDMKQAEGVALARKLVGTADGLIEGFRPGVMERLGLGPEELLGDNPKLVYGRMTGWGQSGPLAQAAGHDINYIALSGVLHTVGRAGERPVPPVNYVGDFGGGGMMLAFAMVSALLGVRMGRPGQVIDAAMTDGSALLAGMTYAFHGAGMWRDQPGVNLLDGAAHFYDTYQCADGKFVAIGAIEPQFYALLLEATGLQDDPAFAAQMDPRQWPTLKARLTEVFATKTRDEWTAIMEGTDICFAPVLSLGEAPAHPHNVARGTFGEVGGAVQPMPAPRYSDAVLDPPRVASDDSGALVAELGLDAADLRGRGVIG
jgi:alpha-methylacyl-CoA racemase